jgi:lipoprotein Spr
MRAGDLIFFQTGDQQKHVGIYLDDRKFIHASSSEGVTISPLRYDYWQNHYRTTKRLSVL